jgi:hypothetical protein
MFSRLAAFLKRHPAKTIAELMWSLRQAYNNPDKVQEEAKTRRGPNIRTKVKMEKALERKKGLKVDIDLNEDLLVEYKAPDVVEEKENKVEAEPKLDPHHPAKSFKPSKERVPVHTQVIDSQIDVVNWMESLYPPTQFKIKKKENKDKLAIVFTSLPALRLEGFPCVPIAT